MCADIQPRAPEGLLANPERQSLANQAFEQALAYMKENPTITDGTEAAKALAAGAMLRHAVGGLAIIGLAQHQEVNAEYEASPHALYEANATLFNPHARRGKGVTSELYMRTLLSPIGDDFIPPTSFSSLDLSPQDPRWQGAQFMVDLQMFEGALLLPLRNDHGYQFGSLQQLESGDNPFLHFDVYGNFPTERLIAGISGDTRISIGNMVQMATILKSSIQIMPVTQ